MVAGKREVGDGVGIDASWQHFAERPYGEGETVDVVDDTERGEETVENVPRPPESDEERRPDVEGQSRLDDWEWSL